MQSQAYSIGCVTENRAIDIISKVGSLAMVGEIGATKANVADFFDVGVRTIEKALEINRKEFLRYGNYKKTKKDIKKQVTDKSIGTLVPKNTSKINLFNRKHIMLFACHLNHLSEIAKRIVHYLIEAESLVSSETRLDALLMSLVRWDDLSSEERPMIYMQVMDEIKKAKPLVCFAESVGDTTNLVSINDFAKSTCKTLGLGKNKLFKEMRFDGILNSKNIPYQNFINSGYFEVITKTIANKTIHQSMVTGKGEIFLFNRMKKRLGI